MDNAQKLEKVKDLVNQIALTVGDIDAEDGTQKERMLLLEASAFAETFVKDSNDEDDYSDSEDYNDSGCSEDYYQSNC